MAIPQDQYTTAVSSNFITRAYANLSGNDLFFYISTTNELRVKQVTNANIRLLQAGVKWMCLIQAAGVVHLYFTLLNGAMYYAPFTIQNLVAPIVPVAITLNTFFTFSACYAANSTPPCYVLVSDDGQRHNLYTSATPDFVTFLGTSQIFNNSVDRAHYVNNPIVALHPDDTNAVTINCERTTIQTSVTEVGFYVVALPGVS